MTRDPLTSLSGELVIRPQAGSSRAPHTGEIAEVMGSGLYRVSLGDQQIVAHLAGDMRLVAPRLIPGDRVLVEISSYDPSRGRIVRRLDGE
jgi:translation initiation factor IF-1